MNNSINTFLIIFFLGWLLHVPETLPDKVTNGAPVKFAKEDAATRQPRTKRRDSGRETQVPQVKKKGNPGTGKGETSKGEFVPSEEVKAGQAVDFPADI